MRRGRPPAPRVQLNPALREAVQAAIHQGRKSWFIALEAGFPQPQKFSCQLRQEWLEATPRTIARFERVADIVGFPRSEIFSARMSSGAGQ